MKNLRNKRWRLNRLEIKKRNRKVKEVISLEKEKVKTRTKERKKERKDIST